MPTTLIPVHIAMRAACVQLLRDYAQDAEISMQIYEGHPATINAPAAFVEGIREDLDYPGMTLIQRRPRATVVVLHGLFDTRDTAEQTDAFVDGFVEWVAHRYHAAGANSTIGVVNMDYATNYVPDWLPPERQRSYYASLISVEGRFEDS